MSAFGAPEAVRRTILVRCAVDAAFRIWTERINEWWPKGHSRSGNPSITVFLECRMGGQIYERTPDGVEHTWGRITEWDPPRHFAYHWYLGSGAEQPTWVDVHFVAHGTGSTRVNVSHRGPELIGDLGPRNRAIYDAAWEQLLPAYRAACDLAQQLQQGGQ